MHLTELTLHNFRTHSDLTVSLSRRTVIRGHNATGKSSLAEAIVWCLYGTDKSGASKQDEQLILDSKKEMSVSLTGVTDDGQIVKITRTKEKSQVVQVGGKRQGAQQKIEDWFGSLPEFLTMFWPGYFSFLEPKAARAVLARCSPVLTKEEVLQALSKNHRDILSGDQYPMVDGLLSLDYLLSKTRHDLRQSEDEQVRLEGEICALQGVLTKEIEPKPVRYLTPERVQENAQLEAKVDAALQAAATSQARLSTLEAKRSSLKATYDACRSQWQKVIDACPTCHQKLSVRQLAEMRQGAQAKNARLRRQMNDLIGQGQLLKEQIAKLTSESAASPDVDALTKAKLAQYKIDEDRDRRAQATYAAECQVRMRAQTRIKEAQHMHDKAKMRSAHFARLVDALIAYRLKYILLQHDRLQAAFTDVSIELTDANRETGEIRQVFRILFKGRAYRMLSQSEKIRCDLEIARVIARAKKETMPVFVDNAESIEHLFGEVFFGQVIATYVADCPLTIERLEETKVSA